MERDVYFAEVKECMSSLRSFVGIAISEELTKAMQMEDAKILHSNNFVSNIPILRSKSVIVTPDSQIQYDQSGTDKISKPMNQNFEVLGYHQNNWYIDFIC